MQVRCVERWDGRMNLTGAKWRSVRVAQDFDDGQEKLAAFGGRRRFLL
jgi:hypothetical protein